MLQEPKACLLTRTAACFVKKASAQLAWDIIDAQKDNSGILAYVFNRKVEKNEVPYRR